MIGSLRRSLLALAASSLAVTVMAGCGSARQPVLAPVSRPAATPSSATSPTTGSAAGCASGAWQLAPITVTHSVVVPPVPIVAAIRTAQHPECGYDRLVLDITGAVPSYSIRYVAEVTGDPSGRPIALPGTRFLQITLHDAEAHSAAGTPTISHQTQMPGYPSLQSWVLAGDNEGVVTVAVGLPRQVSVRTGELPGHLYVDLKE